MICTQCGNQIVVGCGPVCLACADRACRANAVESQARGLAVALDAVYRVMDQGVIQTEEQSALIEFEEAKERLSARIRDQEHSREKPNWDEIDAEEKERREICQSCMGTGRYLASPCPDCQED